MDLFLNNLDPFADQEDFQYYDYEGSGYVYEYPESSLSIYSPGM